MPAAAALVKTIIISLSLLTAVGIAVLENPQVREWVEEQRRKVTEALRSLGEELDPHSRREAESFAYEGRLPGQRERTGSQNAYAIATGRDGQTDAVSRRLRSGSSQSAIDLEERRRLGREYLARRNQLLLDREQEKSSASVTNLEPSDVETLSITEKQPLNNSFDGMVNNDGTLRSEEKPPLEATMGGATTPMGLLKGALGLDTSSQDDTNQRSFHTGSRYANPFGDEYELADTQHAERSGIVRPPVPPKIALDEKPSVHTREIQEDNEEGLDNLSYEEQLARALSLSLAENERTIRLDKQRRQSKEEDASLAAAIRASLENEQHDSLRKDDSRGIFHNAPQSFEPYTDDELYTLSPQHTHAQPAFNADRYDPVHEAAANSNESTPALFQSISSLSAEPRSKSPSIVDEPSIDRDLLIDLSEQPEQTSMDVRPGDEELHVARTIETTTSTPQLRNMTDSHDTASNFEADDFSSLPDSEASRSRSIAASDMSLVEVEDVDIDSMPSDDDGIRTPGSWTDVGSQVDDSERSEDEAVHVPVRI